MKRLSILVLSLVLLFSTSLFFAAAKKPVAVNPTADSVLQNPAESTQTVITPIQSPLESPPVVPQSEPKSPFNWNDFWNALKSPVDVLLKALLTYLSTVVGFNLLIFMPIISELLNIFRKNKKQIEDGKITQEQAFEFSVKHIEANYKSKVPLINKRFGSVQGLVEFVYRKIFKK